MRKWRSNSGEGRIVVRREDSESEDRRMEVKF